MLIFFYSSTTSPCSEQENDILISESKDESHEPIQFETQNDITDEDLQKYLEELEEEEEEKEDSSEGKEEEIISNPNEEDSEAESKPVRPGFLDLNDTKTECIGSPGQTPLPKDVEQADVVFSETPR